MWDELGGPDAYGDGHEGFELYIDGKPAAFRLELGPMEARLPRR